MVAECRGRVEKMRRYLTEYESVIEAATSGSVSFDFNDLDVTAKVVRVDKLREPSTRASSVVMD